MTKQNQETVELKLQLEKHYFTKLQTMAGKFGLQVETVLANAAAGLCDQPEDFWSNLAQAGEVPACPAPVTKVLRRVQVRHIVLN